MGLIGKLNEDQVGIYCGFKLSLNATTAGTFWITCWLTVFQIDALSTEYLVFLTPRYYALSLTVFSAATYASH